jgi:hypothetical protein
MDALEEEIRNRVLRAISDVQIDCPDCESMDDDQYTCTTCWCEGGNGRLYVNKFLVFKKE